MSNIKNIIHVTDSSFKKEVIEHDGIVIVDFWAAWCGPCRMLEPHLEELATMYPKLRVAKLNVDENPSISTIYNVRGIPMMMLVTNDRDDQGRRRSVITTGFMPRPSLEEWIGKQGVDLTALQEDQESSKED